MKRSIHFEDDLFYGDSKRIKRFWDKLEAKRKEALSNQDCLTYFNFCNRLGREPEDIHLYEMGEAENFQ